MTDQPTVCAICLTRDRPELAAKAVECFRRQTYDNKRLLIWNTSIITDGFECFDLIDGERQHYPIVDRYPTIGSLRNGANLLAIKELNADILIHFDDDDWSHPNRISEQVALLQASGADIVGYSEMLFWRDISKPKTALMRMAEDLGDKFTPKCEAWLYNVGNSPGLTPVLGTSLCYWRKTWEQRKFQDLPKPGGGVSEYSGFLRGLNVAAESSLSRATIISLSFEQDPKKEMTAQCEATIEPRMIARIHGGNFGPYDIESQIERGSREWQRVPSWDARVKEILG